MAREGDLPRALAVVHPRYRVPQRAEIAVAAVVVALVLTVDLRGVVGFSSFGVLLYYVVANAAAFTQERADRRYPRALQALGVVGCLVLVARCPGRPSPWDPACCWSGWSGARWCSPVGAGPSPRADRRDRRPRGYSRVPRSPSVVGLSNRG
ncbi:hypothetical protein DOU02_15080 [Clavibacter michiganensis subsp. michiganensis]|nr:hypothetical protein DOU02_15080 [Clavibacter michiganensis subsp. michiganensis]